MPGSWAHSAILNFLNLKEKKASDPAQLLFALDDADLDSRVAEGLPWLALTYVDMDWDWLLQKAQQGRRQNRLGFVVALAIELARDIRELMGARDHARRRPIRHPS